MANGAYFDSNLLAAVGIMDKKFNEKELRKPVYGAFDAFLNKRSLLIPSHKDIWKAEQQTLTAKYLERSARAVSHARSCSPTADYGDSGTLNLSWTTYAQTVITNVKGFENNEYSQQEAFANDLYNAFMDLYADIEGDAVAYLEANRTGLQGNRTLNTWDGAADVMRTALADRDNYLNYIKTELFADSYRGTLQDIHTVNMMAQYRQQFAQGASNDENLTFQFPGFEHYVSQQITDGTGSVYGTSYIVEEGGIAVLDWIPFINRRGKSSRKGEVWTTMADPFGRPLTWSVFKIDGCYDTSYSSSGDPSGMTQDYREIYEISIDLSWNHAPITTALETPIYKYEQLTV